MSDAIVQGFLQSVSKQMDPVLAESTSFILNEAKPASTLRLEKFSQKASLDFGRVRVGSTKSLTLELDNPTTSSQDVQLVTPPSKGFDVEGFNSTTLHRIQPGKKLLVVVRWTPRLEGSCRENVQFLVDGKFRFPLPLSGTAIGGTSSIAGSLSSSRTPRSSLSSLNLKPASSVRASTAASPDQSFHRKGIFSKPPIPSPSRSGVQRTDSAALDTSSQDTDLRAARSTASHVSFHNNLDTTPSWDQGSNFETTGSWDSNSLPSPNENLEPAAQRRPPALFKTSKAPPRLSLRRSVAASSPPRASLSTRALSPTQPQQSPARSPTTPTVAPLSDHVPTVSLAAPELSPGSGRKVNLLAKRPVAPRRTTAAGNKGMFLEKQEKAFMSWLNECLAPKAPDMQVLSAESEQLNALTSRRLLARVTGLLSNQLKDSEVNSVMNKVQKRIEEGRLKMKEKGGWMGDLHVRDHGLHVLLSFNPFWLRLGLRTVVGKAVAAATSDPTSERSTAWTENLGQFLKLCFLDDPDLKKEMSRAAKVDKSVYYDELGKLVLKRVLMLVLLLDRTASRDNLPSGTPLLFRKDSPIKASTQVIQEFLKNRLQGEGNVLRHLELAGYKLRYHQTPLMEYPFQVTSLATDLRDGLRLCRVVELVTGTHGLLGSVRFPSDRRPVQVYNTNLALDALRSEGVTLENVITRSGPTRIVAEHLVDGDRERTLGFLWTLLMHLQLPRLINPAVLQKELERIAAKRRFRMPSQRRMPQLLDVYLANQHITLLMQWVQAICMCYGVRVDNFTSSFSDGKVLCFVMSYYLPEYLSEEDIYQPETEPAPVADEGTAPVTSYTDDDEMMTKGWFASFSPNSASAAKKRSEQHKAGVLRNFEGLHTAAQAIGGVPEMLSGDDFLTEGPDEHAVIMYTAFLCARLLEVSKEDRAALIIQQGWNRYKYWQGGVAGKVLRKWVHAASVVQRYARAWLLMQGLRRLRAQQREDVAAICILQGAIRTRSVLVEITRQHLAATTIQASWRMCMAAKQFQAEMRGIVLMQSLIRAWNVRQVAAPKMVHAIVTLQTAWRGRAARQLLNAHFSARTIQAAWRGWSARNYVAKQHQAAVTIQAVWRMTAVKLQLQRQHTAATAIQAAWRSHVAQQRYWFAKTAATVIQACFKGYRTRQQVTAWHRAATRLQAAWRRHVQRKQYNQVRTKIIYAQAHVRGYLHRRQYHRTQQAVIRLQAAVRRWQAVRELHRHKAARLIQTQYRSWMAQQAYQEQRKKIIRIQAAWRCYSCTRSYNITRQGIIQLQACTRQWLARSKFQRQRQAAITIQSHHRAAKARELLGQHKAARCIQSYYRMHVARCELQRAVHASTVLQAKWREYSCRRSYAITRAGVVQLQAAVRGWLARSSYLCQRQAAITIQSHYRAAKARELLSQHKAARCIQSYYRMHVARCELQHAVHAATVLQARWREFYCRRRYTSTREGIIQLQARTRSWLARSSFLRLKQAAVTIQSHYRAAKARELLGQHKAARCIQSYYRMHVARCELQRAVHAATVLQAKWRAVAAMRKYQHTVELVVKLQAWARASLQKRSYKQQVSGIVTVQKVVRGYLVRKSEARRKAAAILIQAKWKQILCQRAYHADRSLVILVQACARGWLVRQQLAKEQLAAVRIQSTWRRYTATQEVQVLRACSTVQRCVRQRQAAALLQRHKAARTIQTAFRTHHASKQLRETRAAAIYIQNLYRAHTVRDWYEYTIAMIRLEQAIAEWNIRRQCATYIQRVWRGFYTRKMLEPVWEAHRQAKQQAAAAVIIQAHWRAYKGREAARQRRAAIEVIRQYLPLIQARCRLLRTRKAVQSIQAAWRKHQEVKSRAAVVLQAYVRGWQMRRRYQRIMQGICRFQAVWRGYVARKASGRVGRELRRRIKAANADAELNPHKRLCARMQDALQALLRCKNPETAMVAVEKMRHFTMYSKNCCKVLVEGGGAAQLLNFIRTCNRSKPHVDLVMCAVNVLLDVARYPELIPGLYSSSKDSISILSERLQFYRDMEDVFMITLQLLARLVTVPEIAAEVAMMSATLRQWEGISQLLTRKVQAEKMYIARLEGQKGSDVAAREATRKMISATQQNEALQAVLAHVAKYVDGGTPSSSTAINTFTTAAAVTASSPVRQSMSSGTSMIPGASSLPLLTEAGVLAPVTVNDVVAPVQWKPKNTICRETVKEIAFKKTMATLTKR